MKRKRRSKNPVSTCSFCGQNTAGLVSKNHTFGKGNNMLVFESIPTFVCSNCDSVYITAAVSRAMDEVLAAPEQYTERRAVSVAKLAA
ncbi:MAG: YgiT-type zinc finger protein [Acidobacteria bacterium]|nr:YgiT-type zinc finger protein [Acidobacteriota bacterium]